mmetsp:Transcript_1808/g.5487  ORF Transcript_1808/g.5487 Transcript_1808/m.5487 type:complete len:82 (+) Transcript_1808:529-774(+)
MSVIAKELDQKSVFCTICVQSELPVHWMLNRIAELGLMRRPQQENLSIIGTEMALKQIILSSSLCFRECGTAQTTLMPDHH